jgi:pimeloyl-ACP methyl ester carboxylesterase
MTTANELHPNLRPHAAPVPRRRTGLLGRIAGIALGAAAAVGIVAVAGAAYEAIATTGDAAANPRPGRMVDVGGYSLHLDCRGEGSPTIVMDAGLGKSSLDWILVQPELARQTQVCAYDRAGMGWSEASPAPRTPSQIADELHLMLKTAGVPGPYLLVGHSLAGKTVRLFAAAHPDDVAGIVLVDARSERLDATADTTAFGAALKAQANLYSLARRLGIARLFGASLIDLPLVSPAVATEMALLETSPVAIETTTAEGLLRAASDDVLTTASLGSIPLVVIAAGKNMSQPDWAAAQLATAGLSSNGELIVAEGSGHAVHLEQPETVIDAVARMVDDIRSGP